MRQTQLAFFPNQTQEQDNKPKTLYSTNHRNQTCFQLEPTKKVETRHS